MDSLAHSRDGLASGQDKALLNNRSKQQGSREAGSQGESLLLLV